MVDAVYITVLLTGAIGLLFALRLGLRKTVPMVPGRDYDERGTYDADIVNAVNKSHQSWIKKGWVK